MVDPLIVVVHQGWAGCGTQELAESQPEFVCLWKHVQILFRSFIEEERNNRTRKFTVLFYKWHELDIFGSKEVVCESWLVKMINIVFLQVS